jgi:hypothetical protein
VQREIIWQPAGPVPVIAVAGVSLLGSERRKAVLEDDDLIVRGRDLGQAVRR